ncbi:MAG: hypothetical protein MJZ77_05185 [Bacteroidales bacterium]|nr:hypothetical protein [Bacteroidales bacterium]
MTYSKKIAKFWTRFGIILMIALGAITLVFRWHSIFPTDEVSELYTRYEHVEGLDVSYIKDFKVNDTVCVDVTMLEAKTDSAWTTIQTDFNVPIIPEEYQELLANYNSVDSWLAPKENYKLPMNPNISNNDAIAVLRKERTISVFHTRKDTPIDDIFTHKLNKL